MSQAQRIMTDSECYEEPAPGSVARSPEDERLLQLFWNRAELKKSLASLRADRDQLAERLGEEENRTNRARDELRSLEERLSSPETGYQAIVFYQLRGLWDACTEQLVKFAQELEKQQHDRERKKQIMDFNLERDKRLKAVGIEIRTVKEKSDRMKVDIADIEVQLDKLGGFWNYFKRRGIAEHLQARREQLAEIREEIEQLFDRRIKIESEQWPDYAGLGLEGRRAINVAVLALTQYLYLHFTEHSLSTMARTSRLKTLSDVSYGEREECDYLMERIHSAVAAMRGNRGYADALRARANYLRETIKYGRDSDTIPSPESLSETPMQIVDGRCGMTVEVNVLADNYWNVLDVLLR